jgi:FkbM family methyltransferase
MIIRRIFNKLYNRFKTEKLIKKGERKRLHSLNRYVYTQTKLFGKTFRIVDSVTFLSSLDEIFQSEIYKFITTDEKITIIDCGANIGLATLYFKIKYPNAEIISFEPDPNIFNTLRDNILNQGFNDVTFRNEAISNEERYNNFYLEGGHSGMIVQEAVSDRVIRVKTTRLKNVLNQFDEITFLKIDIEGHERFVIPDIADELKKVKYLFLEYHSSMDTSQNLDEILKIIKSSGLRYYIKESCNKPIPFITREIFLKMDLILNIFCYRT